MKAVIAEKPSVAKEIAALLGATEKRDGYLAGNGSLSKNLNWFWITAVRA